MSIILWLKREWYLPQLNKAIKKVAYYEWSVQRYVKMINQGQALSRKDDGRFGYHKNMLASWEFDKEKLEKKLEKIDRNYER